MPTYRPQQHTHKLVDKTATEMAHELYDTMMGMNDWYELWKSQNPGKSPKELESRFVARNKARLIPQARAMLAHMLTTSIDESLKETIMEALSLDASLLRHGVDPNASRRILKHETRH